jgi:acyl-CoA reductase-like NAD-dependent aldehyde dehydrogenase
LAQLYETFCIKQNRHRLCRALRKGTTRSDFNGVIAATTPWNFPSPMLAHKLGPALAAGYKLVEKLGPPLKFMLDRAWILIVSPWHSGWGKRRMN